MYGSHSMVVTAEDSSYHCFVCSCPSPASLHSYSQISFWKTALTNKSPWNNCFCAETCWSLSLLSLCFWFTGFMKHSAQSWLPEFVGIFSCLKLLPSLDQSSLLDAILECQHTNTAFIFPTLHNSVLSDRCMPRHV